MHAHPVEFEREPTAQFGDRESVFLRVLFSQVRDQFTGEVNVFDIPGIEPEVHLDLLGRELGQIRQIKRLYFISHIQKYLEIGN